MGLSIEEYASFEAHIVSVLKQDNMQQFGQLSELAIYILDDLQYYRLRRKLLQTVQERIDAHYAKN